MKHYSSKSAAATPAPFNPIDKCWTKSRGKFSTPTRKALTLNRRTAYGKR